MLTRLLNEELYVGWENHIDKREPKRAFRYIDGFAACSSEFRCELHRKGYLRDFRIYNLLGHNRIRS